jgi:hypothetical protein
MVRLCAIPTVCRPTNIGRLLGAILAVSGVTQSAQGQDVASPSAKQLALSRDLVAALGVEATLSKTVTVMLDNLARDAKNKSPQQVTKIDSYFGTLKGNLAGRTSELIDAIVPIYAEQFSSDELEQIISFYRSPAGKVLLAREPELLRQTSIKSSQWVMRALNASDKGRGSSENESSSKQ